MGIKTETCPVCGVKIMVGIVGGDRVQFSAGPPGTRAKLYARVCRYANNPRCINQQTDSASIKPDDYYKPDAPSA